MYWCSLKNKFNYISEVVQGKFFAEREQILIVFLSIFKFDKQQFKGIVYYIYPKLVPISNILCNSPYTIGHMI